MCHDHKKIPNTVKLNLPELINTASHLPLRGILAISANNLVYLDIDDAYIHQLFPLLQKQPVLQNQQIKKPDYFGETSAGAHITVIYPEEYQRKNKNQNKNGKENIKIHKKELNQTHHFVINEIVTAEIGLKTYYVLLIESPSLLQLRRKYNLPDQLCFKGYAIGLHITIGIGNEGK